MESQPSVAPVSVERMQRMRRLHAAEYFLAIFEETYRQKVQLRDYFRLAAGLVCYAHLLAMAVFFTAGNLGYCAMYLTCLPAVMLTALVSILSTVCMVIAVTLAARAEVCQVWRLVLTSNVASFFGSLLVAWAANALFREAREHTWSFWGSGFPLWITLTCYAGKNILVRSETSVSNVALAVTAMLCLLLSEIHVLTGIHSAWIVLPVPLCILVLVALRFRSIGLQVKRQEHTCGGLAVDLSTLLGYALLLIPAVEICMLVCMRDPPYSKVLSPTILAVPAGTLLLGPALVKDLGEWAESIAFGFLLV